MIGVGLILDNPAGRHCRRAIVQYRQHRLSIDQAASDGFMINAVRLLERRRRGDQPVVGENGRSIDEGD